MPTIILSPSKKPRFPPIPISENSILTPKINNHVSPNYKELKHKIEKYIYRVASNKETHAEKINQLKILIDENISEQKEYKTQILLVAIHELLCTSFITEHQLYEMTNIIFKEQKQIKNSKTFSIEEGLLHEIENGQINVNPVIEKLNKFLSENNPYMGFIMPNLSPKVFIALGVIAFFAAYNGFTGGAEACSLFTGNMFESDHVKKIESLDYIVGFVSLSMIWWAFVSASVDAPRFSQENSCKKNFLLALSCLHAVGQSIPSAMYTRNNEMRTKTLYFPFEFLKKDSENINFSGYLLIFSNFTLNTYFGLGQAQGTKNLYHYLVVRFNNTVSNIERIELLYDVIAAFLKTMLLIFIFIQPICDITEALTPSLEWLGKLLLAIYLNVGEIKFYSSAHKMQSLHFFLQLVLYAIWEIQEQHSLIFST